MKLKSTTGRVYKMYCGMLIDLQLLRIAFMAMLAGRN